MAVLKTLLLSILSVSAIVDPSLAVAVPTTVKPRAACTSPILRKEWSAATQAERTSYTNAVLCLATKKSKIGLSTTLYDDFSYVHNKLNLNIHGVAAFLPWHRYFIHVYELALKDCGYTGVAMYWNWVADSAAPSKAKVWDPTTGFGGNGDSTAAGALQYCVTDGPFKDLKPAYWGNDTMTHCLRRDFVPAIPQAVPPLQEMLGFGYDQSAVDAVNANTDFLSFHSPLEGGPHGNVHGGVGGSNGDMGPLTSPNDPIFFLHHTQVDRIWWLWQQQNPSVRTNDFAGNLEDGSAASLTDIMPMLGLASDRAVADFMSTSTADLCYKY